MTAAIQVDRLAKAFGGLRAVDEVSIAIPPGERRVLIGPNGAGKTTLFNCIAGTHRPTSGRVLMFGTDISQMPENRRTALGMGRTFQISNVCTDLTVLENLLLAVLGTDRRKWIVYRSTGAFPGLHDRVLAGLAKVGLADRADEPVKFLSYGERRQLELALALSSHPKVLLLDEPCAAIDPPARTALLQVMGQLRDSGLTLLVSSHDWGHDLDAYDRVLVLDRQLLADGSPPQVRRALGDLRVGNHRCG